MTASMLQYMRRAPVIPVIVLQELSQAVPLAEALVAGGLPVLEVTLRTPVALPAIEAMRRAVPEAIVGAGTLTTPAQFAAARAAGAQFGVSPGLTPELADAARAADWPFLPGIMTASELMRARALGYTCCKLFPAQQAGGTGMLKALHAVFSDVCFCPTGGVTPENATEFLALPCVPCVGGSWVAPAGLLNAGDWSRIRHLAEQAAALPRTGTADAALRPE
jgi:2-dehydro-3-deoxyphosphogluconate aldolase / (4S)-4-hydroxy-2-oxoglutarate aldolase